MCEAYLAFVFASASTKLYVKEIRTVKDFPYVFPEELPSVPLDRKVKFGIDLLSGTTPTSIALEKSLRS